LDSVKSGRKPAPDLHENRQEANGAERYTSAVASGLWVSCKEAYQNVDFFRRQNWDIVGKWPLWFGLSAIPIVLGIIFLSLYSLNWGTDFTGGSSFTFQFATDIVSADQQGASVVQKVRDAMPTEVLRDSEIQISGTRQVLIRTGANEDAARAADEATLKDALTKALGDRGGAVSRVGMDFVGPVVGADLQRKALTALAIGSLLIILYITIRYEFRFAAAGWLALIHDVLVLIGGMAVLRLVVDSSFVAVVLTILGYSIHDTIIIFDRIRENRRLHRGTPFATVVNASITQTFARSINTVLCTLFPLIALFFLGGPRLHAFVTALIIGLVSGAYSSIFMAAPIVVLWQGRRSYTRIGSAIGAAPTASGGPRPRPAARRAPSAQSVSGDEPAPVAPANTAMSTMARAQAAAQEEKRAERRERRQQKKSEKKPGGGPSKGGKRRF
jgi:preprotein translocase subunit SecF